jgi:CDP-paratose 2-epimerase
MKILLVGGCGFIGFNIFKYLKTKKKKDIFIVDDLSGQSSKKNLQNLRRNYHKIKFKKLDVSNFVKISSLIKKFKPDAILALHGQVAVTKSIINPRKDFNSNFLSVFNLLESIKLFCPKSIIINLSSNKLYGKINNLNLFEQKKKYYSRKLINENYPLSFESPYACSKGAADQYLLDYSKLFNIKAVSLRLSCVYGENQWGTEDQGWIAWFIKCSLTNQKIRLFGNGKQVRDVLHVHDLARLIYILLNKINKIRGHPFNIGGGRNNTLSLLELIEKLEKKIKKKIKYSFLKQRFGDQKYFVNDLRKVTKMTGWKPKISVDEGITRYLNWIIKNQIKLK